MKFYCFLFHNFLLILLFDCIIKENLLQQKNEKKKKFREHPITGHPPTNLLNCFFIF